MKLPIKHWTVTLRALGLRWKTSSKKKRRKSASNALDFGPLEPRKLLAGAKGPAPLPDPDPDPPPVVVSGPETSEQNIVSDQTPDVRVGTMELVDPGMIVDGDLSYASPVMTGAVEGDFVSYPRLRVEFDLEAVGAQLQGNLYSADAYYIVETPATDPTFQLDPNNPPNVGAYNPFVDNPGWKEIGYRVVPIDANGDALTDSEGLMLASPWESIGFQLIDPAEGPVRIVDVDLVHDTDDPTDQQTQDPRVEVLVHGEFQAAQTYRLEFEYQFNGQTQTDYVDVPQFGAFVYDPLVNNPNLAYETMTVDLTYRLMSSSDSGTTWTQISSDLYSFNNIPILEANIGELIEESGETPYRGGDRLLSGFLQNTEEDSTVPYLVEVEYGVPDGSGGVTWSVDGEATVRFDEDDQRFEYSHVLIDSGEATVARARVKQWIRGEYKYSPWEEATLQEPQPYELGSVSIEEEPARENDDWRGPGLAPKIIGFLDGAPTVEALEDNSEEEDPLDYRELSNVRVEFFHATTAPDENSVADDHVQTDSFGHFEYRPESLSLGANQIWVRTVLELDNGDLYYGTAQSVSIDVDNVELPTLAIELLDTDAVQHTDEITGDIHWTTSDPRIGGTLTTTDTSLHAYQVTIEYAVDAPNVANDETEIVGRSYAGYEDKTSYYPLIANHEGEIVKIRARVAYYHPQLGEEVYSDWTEIAVELEAGTHEASTISELDVLGNAEKNASDEPIVRGDSAWIAGTVTRPEGSYGAVTVQIRDVATGTELGRTTSSASGHFTHLMKNLSVGSQQIEAVVLDWNYQTAAVEAGPATALTFEVQAIAEIVVDEFELHSDTGTSDSDNITSNPTMVGKLSGDGNLAGVRVAITRNDGQETIVLTDSSGRFIYRGEDLTSGQSYTYQARVATWDSMLGDYTYGTPFATDVTFQYQTETGFRAKVGAVGLADASAENYDSTTGVVKDLTLRGRIVAAGPLEGITVHVDFNGDGTVDDSVVTDRFGEFVFVAGSLAAGSVTPQVRVSETSYAATAWVALPTFDYQPTVESGPEIATFSQPNADGTKLTGTITGDLENLVVDILVDHQGQDVVVAQVEVDEQGNFEYAVPGAQVGESLQFKARARNIVSGRWNYGTALTAAFQYQPAIYVDQLTLKNDNVTGGTGTATDGVTDDSVILIQVAGAGSASTVSIEVQSDGGEVETVDLPVVAGLGEYFPADLGMGYHSIRIRVAGSEDAPWQQLNFIYETDASRTESLTLAQELTSLDPNWKTANYESNVSNDEDFDFQLSQAQQDYEADVDAANETLKQQRRTAEAIYEASMRTARQNFEASVPESLRRFELDPFTWPDNPATKPVDVSEQESPYVISYTGEAVDISKDAQYNLDVEAALKAFRTQEEVLQSNLKNDLEAAEASWRTDLQALKATRTADLATARDQYNTNKQGINLDDSGLADIKATLDQAGISYDQALQDNESDYNAKIAQLDSQYVAALAQLQADEQAALPDPRFSNPTFASVKPTIVEYGTRYKTLYLEYQEAKLEAESQWKKDDADALETYEKAQSKADADTAKLLLQLKHERLEQEANFLLTYKTAVAGIQRAYTEALATRTQAYRYEVILKQRTFQLGTANAIYARDNDLADAKLDAVQRWDTGLNTAWSQYQLDLAQSEYTYQLGLNEENRLAAIEFALDDASIGNLFTKFEEYGVTGGGLGIESQAQFAETLAIELAQASRDMKVAASEARTVRDQELANQWQQRRDGWSEADKNLAYDEAQAVKKYKLAEETTGAEYRIQLVHPSFYGRTSYYAQYRSVEFFPSSFQRSMHGTQANAELIVDALNTDRISHQTTYKTEMALAQKDSDEDRIGADATWRINSSATYRNALTLEAVSESETSGWYVVRDNWKTAVQDAYGKFEEDVTRSQGQVAVWVAKNTANSEQLYDEVYQDWKNNVLEELVGVQPTGTPSLAGSKWQRDIDALSTFRTAVITQAFTEGEISESRRDRELALSNDLLDSRQTYFEELADAYWARRNARQQANETYLTEIYGVDGHYVQQAQDIAAARNTFAQARLVANHKIALSQQEKLHETAVANKLHDFHVIRANEVADRSEDIVDAVYTQVVALIPTELFPEYTSTVTYSQANGQFGGDHWVSGQQVYIKDAWERDSIVANAATEFNHSVADANRDYEINVAGARKTLVNNLGLEDLNDAQQVRDLNTLHIGLWVTKTNELTTAIRDAEVAFQTEESTSWATAEIARASAEEVYAIAEAEATQDRSVRDATIERGHLDQLVTDTRDQIKAEHEAHIADLQATYDAAVAATLASNTVTNQKAEALAKFQLDIATEEFESWKKWRIEIERYGDEIETLTLFHASIRRNAEIQWLNDLRVYSNRMNAADGSLIPLPEEVNRDLEIDLAEASGDRWVGRVEAYGDLLLQRTIVQGKHDVDMVTLATGRDNDYANAEYAYVSTVANAVRDHAYETIDLATLDATRATAATTRTDARQVALDGYDSAASTKKHENLVLLGQKRIAFVADYTQKQIDFVNANNTAYTLYDTGINAFEAAKVVQSNTAGTTYTQTVTQSRIDFATNSKLPSITHQTNLRTDRVASADVYATVTADYHVAVANIELAAAAAALGTSTDETLVFERDKALAWKNWLVALKADYVTYKKALVESAGDLAVDLATSTGTRAIDTATAQANYDRDEQAANNQYALDLDAADATSVTRSKDILNARDLAQANADKRLAEELIAAEVTRDNTLDAIKRNTSLTSEERATQTQQANDDYDQAVAQAHHDRIIRTAADGTELGRAIAWNDYLNAEADRLKTYDDSIANADYDLAMTLAAKSWQLAGDLADARAEYEYDYWIAQGQKLKRDVTAEYDFDSNRYAEINNLGSANEYYGLVLQGMIENYARTLEGTGGSFGTETTLQLIDQMVSAYETLATTVRDQTILVQGQVADLAETAAGDVALKRKEAANARADAWYEYDTGLATEELVYDRAVAQATLDAALGNITEEVKQQQITDAENIYFELTRYFDDLRIGTISSTNLKETKAVVGLEQSLADAVAVKEQGLDKTIATARFGVGGLARTLADLRHQATVLAADMRLAAIDWLATSSNSPLLGLSNLLTYTGTVNPADPNATILAWMPYLNDQAVAEDVRAESVADAEKVHDLAIADEDLQLANKTADINYEEAIATSKEWADETLAAAWKDYGSWGTGVAAQLPSEFAKFDDGVSKLSDVEITLDEAKTSWSIIEKRWLATRTDTTWYEGTETSDWRGGDPRLSENGGLDHSVNRNVWFGEIEGYRETDLWTAIQFTKTAISDWISDLNWEAFNEWITDSWDQYVEIKLQPVNNAINGVMFVVALKFPGIGVAAASSMLQEDQDVNVGMPDDWANYPDLKEFIDKLFHSDSILPRLGPDVWVVLPGTELYEKWRKFDEFPEDHDLPIVVPIETPGAMNLSAWYRLQQQAKFQNAMSYKDFERIAPDPDSWTFTMGGRTYVSPLNRRASFNPFESVVGDIFQAGIGGIGGFATTGRLFYGEDAIRIGEAGTTGLGTGGKATYNASADTIIGFVSLGFADAKKLGVDWEPTPEDLERGYMLSYGISRGSQELLAGVATGFASQLGNTGKVVFVIDLAGNTSLAGQGVYDMSQNGFNVQNTIQTVGGALGGTGNILGGLKPLKSLDDLEIPDSRTFAPIGGARVGRGIEGLRNADNFVPGRLQHPEFGTCGLHCAYDALQDLGSTAKFRITGEIRDLIRAQGGLEKAELARLIGTIDDDIAALVKTNIGLDDITNAFGRNGEVLAFVDGNHWVRILKVDGNKVRIFDSGRGGTYDQLWDSFFTRMGADNAIITIFK